MKLRALFLEGSSGDEGGGLLSETRAASHLGPKLLVGLVPNRLTNSDLTQCCCATENALISVNKLHLVIFM